MKVLVALSLLLAFLAFTEARSSTVFKKPTFEGFLKGKAIDDYNRIVGGTVVAPNSKPFQAALFLHVSNLRGFCGGTIIRPNIVLTAAHCWFDGTTQIDSVTVIAGAHNIHLDSEPTRVTFPNLQSVTLHENWSPSTLENDLAIIRLPSNIEFNENIQAIELPPPSALGNSFSGAVATASGWGLQSDGHADLSEELRHVDLPVITNLVCNLYFFGNIQSSHICTNGPRGTGTCAGDSGGPLTTVHEGRTIVIGITSFGLALGCELSWPSAYTRVTSFVNWISANSADQTVNQ